MWYASCPKCNKKVIGDEASGHNCESCGWSGAECNYRYILPMVVMDAEATIIATAFDAQAQAILGKTAGEMKALQAADTAAYDAVFAKAQWKPSLIRMRAKMESYQGNSRLKGAVLKVEPINFAAEGALLLKDIKAYELPEPTYPSAKTEVDADSYAAVPPPLAAATGEPAPMETEERGVKEEPHDEPSGGLDQFDD